VVQASAIHALLIGIDDYPAGEGRRLYRNCRGAVRDALAVDDHLRNAGVPPGQITRLLAPAPEKGVLTGAEGDAGRPTYDNIAAHWLRLIDEVPAGAQIYIHYSGHGGRARTCVPEVKSPSGFDEVLAPCDINDRSSGRYLRDIEIALLLERMSEKGQLVTLVVDSCNSGGIARGDAVARRGDDADPAARPADERGSAIATPPELVAMTRRLMVARPMASSGWYFGASRHVLLAACRENELAYEHRFDGTIRGALTYFWLEALRRLGPAVSYHAAHRTLVAELHAHIRNQSPALIGDADRVVLGLEHVVRPRTIPIRRTTGHEIELGAGQAQMIRIGMRLAVLPPGPAPRSIDLEAMPIVEVESVDTATSIGRLVASERMGAAPAAAIAPGAQAVALSHSTSLTRYVRVAAPSAEQASEDSVARTALTALERAIADDRTNLIAPADEESADYIVSVDVATGQEKDPAYRILDATGIEVPHLGPAIGVDTDAAAAARNVVERLVHLARFQSVRALVDGNPASPLANKLELEILRLPSDYRAGDAVAPAPFGNGELARIAAGSWICVRLTNRAPHDMHVVVFDLQPDWGISQLVPFDSNTVTLAAGQRLDQVVRTWLPDGYSSGTDVFKAIATAAPTEYDWLLLDAIGKPQPMRAVTKAPRNELEALMAALQAPDQATRHVRDVPSAKWTTAMVELHLFRS